MRKVFKFAALTALLIIVILAFASTAFGQGRALHDLGLNDHQSDDAQKLVKDEIKQAKKMK